MSSQEKPSSPALDDARTATREVRVIAGSPLAVVLVGTRVLRRLVAPLMDQLTSAGEAVSSSGPGAKAAASPRKKRDGIISAPMPGRIVTVRAEAGAEVEAGAVLLVIEAMKMQNEILAPSAGTVAKVMVAPGAAVERGAPLLELRSHP